MFQNLPTELLHIIWMYGYNWRLHCDPWKDIMLVLDIQESIPSCFLRDRLPLKRHLAEAYEHNSILQVYPLNPFKNGNPYLPSSSVDQRVPMPWSHLPGEIFRLLSKHGVHSLKTYRRVLHRRYTQHLNRNVFQWNDSFQDLFADVKLCQIENFDLRSCSWAYEFKNIVLRELSRAKFLTTV